MSFSDVDTISNLEPSRILCISIYRRISPPYRHTHPCSYTPTTSFCLAGKTRQAAGVASFLRRQQRTQQCSMHSPSAIPPAGPQSIVYAKPRVTAVSALANVQPSRRLSANSGRCLSMHSSRILCNNPVLACGKVDASVQPRTAEISGVEGPHRSSTQCRLQRTDPVWPPAPTDLIKTLWM